MDGLLGIDGSLSPSTGEAAEASSEVSEASTPFLVVTGAGHPPVNGRYALDGRFSGRPKYKQAVFFFLFRRLCFK